MSPTPLFDPLLFLERDLGCTVHLDASGAPALIRAPRMSQRQIRQATRVLQAYPRLLALQLREGRASVRKLLARGRLALKDGRYQAGPDHTAPTA